MNATLRVIIYLFMSVFIALFITPLIKVIALKLGATDTPNQRRMNKTIMPTMGGLAIYLTFFISTFFLLGSILGSSYKNYILPILLVALIIVITGVVDDIKEINPKQKTIGILLAAIFTYFFTPARFDTLTIPGFTTFVLPGVLNFLLTILWIFTLTNALNLIDGLDGLASGISIISLSTIGIIAYFFLPEKNIFISLTIFAMVASILGFFPHNYHPATIYLGDTGALFLGFMISILSLQGLKNATFVAVLTPLVILGVPITDTFYAMIRRKLNKQSITNSDKMHLHHRLLSLGFTHQSSVLAIYTISAIFSFIALMLNYASGMGIIMLIIATIFGIEILVELIGLFGENRKPMLNVMRFLGNRSYRLEVFNKRYKGNLLMNRVKFFLIKNFFYFYRKKESQKIVFLLNNPFKQSELITKLIKEYTFRLVICFTENVQEEALHYKEMGAKIVPINSAFSFFTKVIYLLASAKIIITDDCYDFLKFMKFAKDIRIIQLWHTTGVMKKIGLESLEKIYEKKKQSQKNSVIYTDFIVSSQKMAEIFKYSFHAKEEQIRKIGVPFTDIFFTKDFFENAKKKFKKLFGELTEKKIILYAPTKRDANTDKFAIGFKQIDEMLTDNTHLFVKPHPFEKNLIDNFGQFAHISSNLKSLSLEELLVNVNILITDYSSIIFDYALANLKGEIIFYNYDFAQYQKTVGLNEEFLKNLPGKVVRTQGELMKSLEEKILQEQSKLNPLFADLNKHWNKKNDGKSIDRFLKFLTKIESGIKID
ncbi:MAG: CDP-glycerol glycerophosphotransferase family protein [Streptococcaceae bacterium]|jgi:UDP-GlcNAc:undecaprenyl-phosphate GlcNAc-1-phosphate transferase|nr:CDP-glycerol glycerophosphotransferase family protein [Streptococcaceae bacterium]